MGRYRLILIFLCIGWIVQPAHAQVNVLAMGDWGTNGPRQREMAQVLADYAARQDRPIDAMLLAGDNFYPKLTGIDDPLWQQAFERMYDPVKLNFPFYPSF